MFDGKKFKLGNFNALRHTLTNKRKNKHNKYVQFWKHYPVATGIPNLATTCSMSVKFSFVFCFVPFGLLLLHCNSCALVRKGCHKSPIATCS